MSSDSSHHPQNVLLIQFSLHVHKSGLKLDSFHLIYTCLRQKKKLFVPGNTTVRQYKTRYCLCRFFLLFYAFFALLHKNNQHVHHLVGCSKKKMKKKIRPTYPISKKSVTGNIQLIFSGLITIIFLLKKNSSKAFYRGLRALYAYACQFCDFDKMVMFCCLSRQASCNMFFEFNVFILSLSRLI